MLARAERLVSAADYRTVVRHGRRASSARMTVYAVGGNDRTRFGFITARTVGNAVVRNRARRRLKAVCHLMLDDGGVGFGFDVVIRAHPPIALAAFSQIEADLRELVGKATRRAQSVHGEA